MKMSSVVISAPLLVFGRGMHPTDDFQNIMRTFSALDLSLIKIL